MTKKSAKKKVARKTSRKRAPAKGSEKPSGEDARESVDAQQGGEGEGKGAPGRGEKGNSDSAEKPPVASSKSSRVVRPEKTQGQEAQGRNRSGRRGRREQGRRPKVDTKELGEKSWKVFQHEIAEEGLALLDESSARALAEKSILVTRAFLEERERRLGSQSFREKGKFSEDSPGGDDNQGNGKDESGGAGTGEDATAAD